MIREPRRAPARAGAPCGACARRARADRARAGSPRRSCSRAKASAASSAARPMPTAIAAISGRVALNDCIAPLKPARARVVLLAAEQVGGGHAAVAQRERRRLVRLEAHLLLDLEVAEARACRARPRRRDGPPRPSAGSTVAHTTIQSARLAFAAKDFSPSSTQSSPSLRALVRIARDVRARARLGHREGAPARAVGRDGRGRGSGCFCSSRAHREQRRLAEARARARRPRRRGPSRTAPRRDSNVKRERCPGSVAFATCRSGSAPDQRVRPRPSSSSVGRTDASGGTGRPRRSASSPSGRMRAAPRRADACEALGRRRVDREVHQRASALESATGPSLAASARPASSRARSMPPSKSPSARASRIHFSTG